MEGLNEKLANYYASEYTEYVKYLIAGLKEGWLEERDLREALEELAELSADTLDKYLCTNNLLDLFQTFHYLSKANAIVDTLEGLRDIKEKKLSEVIKPELPSLPYYSIKLLSQNRP